MSQSIDKLIQRKPVILKETDTVKEAAHAMIHNGVGSVLVATVDFGLVGIVTDRDIVFRLSEPGFSEVTPLSEAMSPELVSVRVTEDLDTAIDIMLEYGIRRLPVMDIGGDRCIGVLSLDDLIASQAIDTNTLSKIVRGQVVEDRRPIHPSKRSEARSEQKVFEFRKKIADAVGLSPEHALEFARVVLGNLIQRIHYSEACHLIAQLPKNLQSEFLDLPAGPRREIDERRLLEEVLSNFDMDEARATDAIQKFWRELEQLTSAGELQDVNAQLPKGFQTLLGISMASGKKSAS